MHLSILIRNYNRTKDLKKTLLLIQKQKLYSHFKLLFQEILLDNSIEVLFVNGINLDHE